jgi:hypothetical protein
VRASPCQRRTSGEQVGAGARVDGVEGLVEQDQLRVLQQHAGEQHALELPDRQFADAPLLEARSPTAASASRAFSRSGASIAPKAPRRGQWPSATRSSTPTGKLRSICDCCGR